MTKPFRIEARLRNNRMATVRAGRTQKAMDQLCDVSSGCWGSFEGLKKSPLSYTLAATDIKHCRFCEHSNADEHGFYTRLDMIKPSKVTCDVHEDRAQEILDHLAAEWTGPALKIAEGVGRDPEWLWPDCILAVKRSEMVAFEMSEVQVKQLPAMSLIINEELGEQIVKLLSKMTKREAAVIVRRFGLFNHEPHTLEEVGDFLGLKRESVRLIESRAMRRLRHPSHSEKLRPFVEDD